MPGLLIDKKEVVKLKINKLLHIEKTLYTKDDLGIIILVNKEQFNHLNNLPLGKERTNYFQSENFLKNVYGSYYIIYNKKKKIVEIREHIHNPSHLREVIDSIRQYLPNDVTIWTGLIPPDE